MNNNTFIENVDLFQISFPRIHQNEAVQFLLESLNAKTTLGVCFPDMSTLNLAWDNPQLLDLLQKRFITFNDGAALNWAARMRGKPFINNLNGTDLCPKFLHLVPVNTRFYLLGGNPGMALKAGQTLSSLYENVNIVGAHHGYLDEKNEVEVIDELYRKKPQVILVGMGNPLQIEFINRYLDDPKLQGTIWLAVGGFFSYYAGQLKRAPMWIRKIKLEWLYILIQQPHKTKRYLLGIPLFFIRFMIAALRGQHDSKRNKSYK